MNYNISLNINKYPENWTIKRFEEIAEFYLGKTPPRNIKSYWDEKFFPWVSISDMIDFGKIYSTKELISKKAYQEIFKGKFSPKETLLMSFKLTIGRTSILKIEAFHNEAIVSIYPNEKIVDKYFLFYYLPIINYNQYFDKAIKGNTLNKSKIANLEIAIPPLPEQQAIAEVLQTIQEAKEKTELVIKATRELKKSMMKHLFTYGVANFDFRLTNESNSNEINSQILNRQSQIKLKDTEIGPIPEHWKVVKLGEVAEKIFGGGTPSTKNHEFWGGHIPWTTSSIIKEDEIVLTNFQRTITEKGLKNSSTNIAPKGSLLLGTRVGVGKSIITNFDIAINQDLTAVVLKEKITNAYFLAYLFKSYYYKSWFEGNKRGATIKGIPREDLINLPIPLPPLSEQQAIANILQAIDDKIQKEEAKKKAIENLFKSMLNNLMSGRLRVRILNGGKNDTN